MKKLVYTLVVVIATFSVMHALSAFADDSTLSKEEDPSTCTDVTKCVFSKDPQKIDTDKDGLPDIMEGDLNGNGELDPDESLLNNPDTDGDGVSDYDEHYGSTKPNMCDSDDDGLSDGIELGKIQPTDINGCHGLFAAGTNFKRPTSMSAVNPDSDGDGLNDGDEDKNTNGWVDEDETDPSLADSDSDDTEDYDEVTLDFNHDGMADFDLKLIKGGKNCSPPLNKEDIDCDGVINARDTDSDNDSCADNVELLQDRNNNGLPDMYDPQYNACTSGTTKSSGSLYAPNVVTSSNSTTTNNKTNTGIISSDVGERKPWLMPKDGTDGAACNLNTHIITPSIFDQVILLLFGMTFLVLARFSLKSS